MGDHFSKIKGSVILNDVNVISNNAGFINIKSHMQDISQILRETSSMDQNEKNNLEYLLKELSELLQQVSEKNGQDAERISKMVKRVVDDATSGDKSMFEVSAKGLTNAAQALAGIASPIVNVVKKIIESFETSIAG